MTAHTLILVRHAQSSHSTSGSDEERPLTEAGKQQAHDLGKQLKDHIAALNTVFLSPAVRAQQTWEEMANGAGLTEATMPKVVTRDVIYSGDPMQMLQAVRMGSSKMSSMLIGHEPTISGLAQLVVKEGGAGEVQTGMPTGSAVFVTYSRDWKEWHSHVGTIQDFVHVASS